MTSLHSIIGRPARVPGPARTAFGLYQALLDAPEQVDRADLKAFLHAQVQAARDLPCDLPASPAQFAEWIANNASQVAERYASYLQARRAGGPRQFFSNRSHALYFLQQVAPSKLVDGAWLYGTVRHAQDWRYHALIRTYLEELGDGDPQLNHVVLYRKLLAEHDCAPAHPLADELYLQGALQLALGQLSDECLPEVIGYNLGYEQLPLHLLITAFELNELGIDPYYFTLHVTIDNASTGHARKAADTVSDLLPGGEANAEFLERVRAGYRLNDLGVGSTAVIKAFDLEQEVVDMLERKRSFGQHMHSDYCRLEGRTINEWLAAPGQSLAFLDVLQRKGWIKRHQDPQDSRFWQLLDGPGAVMFGVFSGYEMQLLRDWISGDWRSATDARETNPFRARFRRPLTSARAQTPAPREPIHSLERLIGQLSPAHHASPAGLEATRIFARQLNAGGLGR